MNYADQAAKKAHSSSASSHSCGVSTRGRPQTPQTQGREPSYAERDILTRSEREPAECITMQRSDDTFPAKERRASAENPTQRPKTSLDRLKGLRPSGRGAATPAPKSTCPTIPLSSVLGKAPQLFDNNRISVVERYITLIDALPRRFKNIRVLYMSGNSLESLEGISQFQELRSLSLANNCLADVRELEDLNRNCSKLEALILEGNPLASSPSYRAQVLLRIPGLKMLDGAKVSDNERKHALSIVRQEQGLVDVIISNSCLIHKLEMTTRLQRVHMEMRSFLFGKLSALDSRADGEDCAPRSMHRLLQLWDCEGNLSAEERLLLGMEAQGMAKRQMVTVDANMRGTEAWKSAFCEVITAQQAASATLMATVEAQHAKSLADWHSTCSRGAQTTLRLLRNSQEMAARENSCDREALISEFREAAFGLMDGIVENRSASAFSPQSVTPKDMTRGETVSGSQLQLNATAPAERTRHHPLRDISNCSGSPRRCDRKPDERSHGVGQQAQQIAAHHVPEAHLTALGNPDRSEEGQWGHKQPLISVPPCGKAEEHAICPERRANPAAIFSTSDDLLPVRIASAEGMSALLSQVSQLQGDLEYHVQGEMHLQAINMQLRQMLETTQHKLQLSVEHETHMRDDIPEIDLKDLSQAMEEALQAQQRLEQRLQHMSCEKRMIEDTARQAAAAALESEQLAQEAVQERDALRLVISASQHEQTDDGADLRSHNIRLEHQLQAIQHELLELKGNSAAKSGDKEDLNKLLLERDGLGNLCKEQNEHLRWHQEQLTSVQVELEAFRSRERRLARAEDISYRALKRRAWSRFKSGVMSMTVQRLQVKQAAEQREIALLKQWIGNWQLATRRLQGMMVLARKRECCLLSWAFSAILSHQALAKADRVNLEIAMQVRALCLGRLSIAAWKLFMRLSAQISYSQCHLDPGEWRRQQVLQRCVSLWLVWIREIQLPTRAMRESAKLQYQSSLKRLSLASFQMACVTGSENRKRVASADYHWKRRVLHWWREGLRIQKTRKLRKEQALYLRTVQLLSAAFGAFFFAVEVRTTQQQLLDHIRIRRCTLLQRQAIGLWMSVTRRNYKSTVAAATRSKLLSRTVEAMWRSRRTLATSRMFLRWRFTALCRALQRRSHHILQQASGKQYLRFFLSAWRRQTTVLSRVAAAKATHEETSALSGRMDQMTTELDERLVKAQRREQEAVLLAAELEDALRQAAESETCLHVQLQELRSAASANAAKSAEEVAKLQSRQHATDARLLESEQQLAEKDNLLQECESALSETVERLEVVVADRESMLQQHNESDVALQKELKHRETRAAELTAEVQRLQSDLLGTETTLASVSSENAYLETRIADLEEELGEERRRCTIVSGVAEIGKCTKKEVEFLRQQLKEYEAEVASLREEAAKRTAECRSAAAAAKVTERSQGFRTVLLSMAEDSTTPDTLRKIASTTVSPSTVKGSVRRDGQLSLCDDHPPSAWPLRHDHKYTHVNNSYSFESFTSRGVDVAGASSETLAETSFTTCNRNANVPALETPVTSPVSPIPSSPWVLRANAPRGVNRENSSDLTVSEQREVSNLRSHIQSLQDRIAVHASSDSPMPNTPTKA